MLWKSVGIRNWLVIPTFFRISSFVFNRRKKLIEMMMMMMMEFLRLCEVCKLYL